MAGRVGDRSELFMTAESTAKITMKWEYMSLMLPASGLILGGKIDAQKLTDHLNERGSEGWELVSVFDTNMLDGKTRDVVAVLKRPVS